MKRTTMMLPEPLIAAVRERVGGQGLAPLVRDLLSDWVDRQPASRSVPSSEAPKPERRPTTPVSGPRARAQRPGVEPSPLGTAQHLEPACRSCGGPARVDRGKLVCVMRCTKRPLG